MLFFAWRVGVRTQIYNKFNHKLLLMLFLVTIRCRLPAYTLFLAIDAIFSNNLVLYATYPLDKLFHQLNGYITQENR